MEAIAARIAGTRGLRCRNRLDAACAMTTPKGNPAIGCWDSRPPQPRPTTVSTSWPASSRARSTGRCSSRRTRTGQERVAGQVECGDGLFPLHGRELVEKLVEGVAALQVVEQ